MFEAVISIVVEYIKLAQYNKIAYKSRGRYSDNLKQICEAYDIKLLHNSN